MKVNISLSLHHKLFVTSLFSIRICHLSVIKSYQQINDRYTFLRTPLAILTGSYSSHEEKALINNLAALKKLLKNGERSFVQAMYLTYLKLHNNLKIDSILSDMVEYTDYVTTVFNNKKEFEDYEMMKDLRNESTNFKSRREHYDDIDTILQLRGDELYRIDHSP